MNTDYYVMQKRAKKQYASWRILRRICYRNTTDSLRVSYLRLRRQQEFRRRFYMPHNKRDVSTPAENYEVVVNPQKVGSDSEPSWGRFGPNRWAEHDFLRKGGAAACARRQLLQKSMPQAICSLYLRSPQSRRLCEVRRSDGVNERRRLL